MKKILFAIAIITTLFSCTTETLTETDEDPDANYKRKATHGDDEETDEDPDTNYKRKATEGDHGQTDEDPDENK